MLVHHAKDRFDQHRAILKRKMPSDLSESFLSLTTTTIQQTDNSDHAVANLIIIASLLDIPNHPTIQLSPWEI